MVATRALHLSYPTGFRLFSFGIGIGDYRLWREYRGYLYFPLNNQALLPIYKSYYYFEKINKNTQFILFYLFEISFLIFLKKIICFIDSFILYKTHNLMEMERFEWRRENPVLQSNHVLV